jgi:hypothetical protein
LKNNDLVFSFSRSLKIGGGDHAGVSGTDFGRCLIDDLCRNCPSPWLSIVFVSVGVDSIAQNDREYQSRGDRFSGGDGRGYFSGFVITHTTQFTHSFNRN